MVDIEVTHAFLTVSGEEFQNVESSVTMFVNEGFVDMEESKVDLSEKVQSLIAPKVIM